MTPTLKLNGYDLVPSSPEEVRSLYGRWTYVPGAPSTVQGEQQFEVVDPTNSTNQGTFDALLTRGVGYKYVGLLVTSNDGNNVGTADGQVPPVGSVINSFAGGFFGWSYSAMPSPTGDVISFTVRTPFGTIPLPVSFDAAKGIADHSVDNRPIELTNGYSIAPADPLAETFTGTSGIAPFFSSVQGHQVFSVYDSAGVAVGSFEGAFTATADILGLSTQAILVTSNDGPNVGTAAGQTPPVGSVYNVIYNSGTDRVLYSSLPSPAGDVISLIEVNGNTVSNNARTLLDASAPPSVASLPATHGQSFVPVSPLRPVGINGLPPREVQVQGYQQFDVLDSAGTTIGSFDADVMRQWDFLGISSEAILVTNDTTGTTGTAPGDVPPVGSIFNYVYFGKGKVGIARVAMPTPSGDAISSKLLTPLGNILIHSRNKHVADRTAVTFFDPFRL
ncbi:hypothetical protein [Mycolicibacterium hodleri]|uniref:hypothetical protein n=1 Tax=Mycolicibacterium hodleri TaxID=49897 RepID=UPI0011281202|nr:hypothetical protein [Mycolicibacterium hodleri]